MKFIIIILLLISESISQTFIREYTYNASEQDSKVSARNSALNQVKLLLIEELGVYVNRTIESKVIESNGKVSDYFEIRNKVVSEQITKTKILEEKWDGDKYYVKCEILVDKEQLKNIIERMLNNEVDNKYRIEKFSNGEINWDTKTIMVTGFGAANKSFPKHLWEKSAEKAAELDAQRKIIEILKGISLESKTRVENFQLVEDEIITKIQGNIRYIQKSSKKVFPTEDTVEIHVKLKLEEI